MFPRGHAGISLIINSPLIIIFADLFPINIICTILIMWFSILPDFDMSNRSILNQINHRGLTHTIEFVIIVSFLFNFILITILYIFELNKIYNLYIVITPLIGLSSHILVDVFDCHGVKFSYILDHKYKLKIIKDNSSDKLNNFAFIIGIILTIITIFISF